MSPTYPRVDNYDPIPQRTDHQYEREVPNHDRQTRRERSQDHYVMMHPRERYQNSCLEVMILLLERVHLSPTKDSHHIQVRSQ